MLSFFFLSVVAVLGDFGSLSLIYPGSEKRSVVAALSLTCMILLANGLNRGAVKSGYPPCR